ncbi:unnamed protein product [Lampetra planeri]
MLLDEISKVLWFICGKHFVWHKQIIRVQSPDGTRRVPVTRRETAADFLKKVSSEFGFSENGFVICKNRDKSGEINRKSRQSLIALNIKHGDMLYLFPDSAMPSTSAEAMDTGAAVGSVRGSVSLLAQAGPSTSTTLVAKRQGFPNAQASTQGIVEEEIDQYLSKQEGKIYRNRDTQLCRHGPMGKCVHCVPLEPFDEDYLNHLDPPVKHMPFHAYIRKLTGGADKGKFVALENISCKIKSGCEGHPPWPDGICTKCQPSAITLNRQKYRHVDNIMFENNTIADCFLNCWRNTGQQRVGFLYGRYVEHKDIPLAIRAEVAAIYEPPQKGSENSLELLPDPRADVVDEIAGKLGLRKVGWIFTDLLPEDTRKGTVKYIRHKDSHFMSAEECIMAGEFQNANPNPCRLSPDGHFGSKFVTVVATGGPDNQVHFEGYQVTNQCMALVRDDCLLPTRDAAELGFVKESSSEQYVPDVFYKDIDKFGNEITQLARPLPLEYLIIDIPTTFPREPQYTFSTITTQFPIENREITGETQDFSSLADYLAQPGSKSLLETLANFHLLIFLATNDVMPLRDHMDLLLDAVKMNDETLAHHFSESEHWATLDQLCKNVIVQPRGGEFESMGAAGGFSQSSSAAVWACKHCTFNNPPGMAQCEVCSLPRS